MRVLREALIGAELTEADLRALAAEVQVCEVGPGEVLVPVDAPSRQSFVVIEGVATVHSGTAAVATLGPGSFIDALAADATPMGATAATPMVLLVLVPRVMERFGLLNGEPRAPRERPGTHQR